MLPVLTHVETLNVPHVCSGGQSEGRRSAWHGLVVADRMHIAYMDHGPSRTFGNGPRPGFCRKIFLRSRTLRRYRGTTRTSHETAWTEDKGGRERATTSASSKANPERAAPRSIVRRSKLPVGDSGIIVHTVKVLEGHRRDKHARLESSEHQILSATVGRDSAAVESGQHI